MEIVAIIILALLVAGLAVYAIRKGSNSGPPASVEVEAERMRLASEVERLQTAEVRANELQVRAATLESDLENERALLKKLEGEHGALKGQVEEARLDVQELMSVKSEHQTRIQNLKEHVADRDDLVKQLREYEQQMQKHIANNSTLDTDVKNLRERLMNEETAHSATDKSLQSLRERVDEMQSNIQDLVALRREHETTIENLNERVADRDDLAKQLGEYEQQMQERAAQNSNLETTIKNLRERLGERDELEKLFGDQFESLSSKTLEQQRKSFMATADQTLKEREKAVRELVKPLSDKIETLEKGRVDSAAALRQQIETLVKANNTLSEQTQTLSSALTHRPQVRGQWGEMQVERVLELSGLAKGLHYETQASDQQGGRTDFIVHMPHKRDIILDSKVSLNAYLESQNAESDEARDTALVRHARAMRGHADDLAKKEYWQSLPDTADFVVMVVPEFALPPAVERDPDLLDRALQNKVVIATHSTLVALLKCVAMGWQERTVADEALQIGELGKELYDRLSVFAGHLTGVGTALGNAVSRYNQSVGSFDSRVMSQARRFSELGVNSTKELPEAKIVDASLRPLRHVSDTNSDGHALSEGSDVNNGPSDLSDDGRERGSRLERAFSSDDVSS